MEEGGGPSGRFFPSSSSPSVATHTRARLIFFLLMLLQNMENVYHGSWCSSCDSSRAIFPLSAQQNCSCFLGGGGARGVRGKQPAPSLNLSHSLLFSISKSAIAS
jgi:hypothetical protein